MAVHSRHTAGAGPGDALPDAQLGEVVGVRDSKNPHGPILQFGAGPWAAFIAGVKTRILDR